MGRCWVVWVGGVEINDYRLGLRAALRLARAFRLDGYNDVAVRLGGGI